jgi:quercetin 2,3-dioxygenase
MVIFGDDADQVTVRVPEDAEAPLNVLFLAGQPLREPVARYGPFVMNTREEISQAIADYRRGLMGRIDF